jgi:outer membrane murein-binding lipoprotein Lpp
MRKKIMRIVAVVVTLMVLGGCAGTNLKYHQWKPVSAGVPSTPTSLNSK